MTMKTLKILLFYFIFLGLSHTVEAQFLKKMISSLGNQIDPSELPSSYTFDYRYTLKMVHKKGDIKISYYLKKGADYFGSLTELDNVKAMEGMLMVHDNSLNAMTIFMERAGRKTAQVVANPDEMRTEENDMSDFTMKKLPSKEILGHTCEGYEMENDDFKITSYVLTDSPVSFKADEAMQNQQNMPKGFDPEWLKKAENSLMMEMHFTHKKKKKFSGSMVCVALEKESKTIYVSEYEFPQTEMLKKLNNN